MTLTMQKQAGPVNSVALGAMGGGVEPTHYLVCDVGTQTCAFDAAEVVEILPYAALSNEPGAPPILAGFLNLGGQPIAILWLARLLNIQDCPCSVGLHTPIVLLRDGDDCVGAIATRIAAVVASARTRLVALPEHLIAEAALNVNGKLLPVVSARTLVLEQEQSCIAELANHHQRRIAAARRGQA